MSVKFEMMNGLHGSFYMPGDKSISHRAVVLGALADGDTIIHNFLKAADCMATVNCFRELGIDIEETDNGDFVVHGKGLHGLSAPKRVLDVGNSGTTARLLSAILCAQDFSSELTGDNSILRRPMKRIIEPLTMMGGNITSKFNNDCPPFSFEPASLQAIQFDSSIASAQVKSSILMAALYAQDATTITEPYQSRNHTELLLSQFGVPIESSFNKTTIHPVSKLNPTEIIVPGDISSAAYFITAALITNDSEITLKNVGMNPTRNGFIDVILSMGADVEITNVRPGMEPTADLIVRSSKLHGVTLEGEIIPRTLDEIPILTVLAAYADGQTVIRDAGELKVKESNRIEVMVDNLTKMGAIINMTQDGLIIEGGFPLHGSIIGSRLDHRVAMSFAVAALGATGKTEIIGSDCVNISYPGFYSDLRTMFPKSH